MVLDLSGLYISINFIELSLKAVYLYKWYICISESDLYMVALKF